MVQLQCHSPKPWYLRSKSQTGHKNQTKTSESFNWALKYNFIVQCLILPLTLPQHKISCYKAKVYFLLLLQYQIPELISTSMDRSSMPSIILSASPTLVLAMIAPAVITVSGFNFPIDPGPVIAPISHDHEMPLDQPVPQTSVSTTSLTTVSTGDTTTPLHDAPPSSLTPATLKPTKCCQVEKPSPVRENFDGRSRRTWKPVASKEVIPLMDSAAWESLPDWLDQSRDCLADEGLGLEWGQCIDAWMKFEQSFLLSEVSSVSGESLCFLLLDMFTYFLWSQCRLPEGKWRPPALSHGW